MKKLQKKTERCHIRSRKRIRIPNKNIEENTEDDSHKEEQLTDNGDQEISKYFSNKTRKNKCFQRDSGSENTDDLNESIASKVKRLKMTADNKVSLKDVATVNVEYEQADQTNKKVTKKKTKQESKRKISKNKSEIISEEILVVEKLEEGKKKCKKGNQENICTKSLKITQSKTHCVQKLDIEANTFCSDRKRVSHVNLDEISEEVIANKLKRVTRGEANNLENKSWKINHGNQINDTKKLPTQTRKGNKRLPMKKATILHISQSKRENDQQVFSESDAEMTHVGASEEAAVDHGTLKSLNEIDGDVLKTTAEMTFKPVLNHEIRQFDANALPKSIDHSDAMAVLLHMEGQTNHTVFGLVKPSTSKLWHTNDEEMSDNSEDEADDEEDSDKDDWEEVQDHHASSPRKSQIPTEPVEITLEATSISKMRKKKEFDLQTYFRRQINKFKREVALNMHKVHLLCLLSRSMYLNKLCNDETVRAQAMSLVIISPELQLLLPRSCNVNHLNHVLTWVTSKRLHLEEAFQDSWKNVSGLLKLTMIIVVILRQLGFLTRLMMSLQPVPFRTSHAKTSGSVKTQSLKLTQSSKSLKQSSQTKCLATDKKSKIKQLELKQIRAEGNITDEDDFSDNVKHQQKKKRAVRQCTKVVKNAYKVDNNCDNIDCEDDNDDDFVPVKDKTNGNVKRNKGKRMTIKGTIKLCSSLGDHMSDSDYEKDSTWVRTKQLRRTSPIRRNKRILSSDVDDHVPEDQWIEVYLEKEKRWICVSSMSVAVSNPNEIEKRASEPVTYVIGLSQDNFIKDVTIRYASKWLTETRKLRIDSKWWAETMQPYMCRNKKRNEIEDRELDSYLHQLPLPKTISAFKSHPLYALRRHLLKFEAIYPEGAVPLGYIRGEPIYARECVHVLHSRENWLKEGMSVKLGETAYKFVKSRPKWNKPKDNPEAKDLEVFGKWQTEVYVPPPAVDGKVPRNAHGNVEMFLPSMLPAGTVHLKIPGLNKVARKLDIDCAPAMIGWDTHCGFSHPLMDGWIVCEEYKDILLAAWDEEQEIIQEQETEKREKRVYDNWRKLIRGLLIRERLKKRFELEEKLLDDKSSENLDSSDKTDRKRTDEKAKDVKYSWPQNRLDNDRHTLAIEKL